MRHVATVSNHIQNKKEGFMPQTRAKTVKQEREEMYAALQHAASCHCLVEERRDCEELQPEPKAKRKVDFRG